MNIRTNTFVAAILAAALATGLGTVAAHAEEQAAQKPGEIASVYVLSVKDGHQAQFEPALKAYAAWRKQAGEKFDWHCFQPVVGADLDYYVVRSGDHHWADLDENAAWEAEAGAGAEFQKQLGAHVDHVEHYLQRADFEHSRWNADKPYRYFTVTHFDVRSGAHGEMMEALGKVHEAATQGEWPKSYSIGWRIGGSGSMTVVTPAESYADMAEPETPFMKLLADSLGSEEAAKATMKQLNSAFEGSETTIVVARPDLMVSE